MNAASPPDAVFSGEFDPVTLEIFWSRLNSIADEAATGLVRTAFSTIVRESNDYEIVLMDRYGNSIAENTGGIASFSCILPRTTKDILKRFPAEPGSLATASSPMIRGWRRDTFRILRLFALYSIAVSWSGSLARLHIRPISAARSGPPTAAKCSRKACAFRRCTSCVKESATKIWSKS